MAVRERKARTKLDLDNLAVVFEFGKNVVTNAGTKEEAKSFAVDKTKTYETKDYSVQIKNQLMLHGLKQKLGDAFADPNKNPEEAADEVHQNLLNGDFNAKGDGTGGMVVEAFARLKKITPEEAATRWNAASDEVRKNAAAAPAMQEMVATIRKERAAKKSADTPDANKVLENI